MLFLITNDDGFHSEGLKLLERIASRYGEVIIVAPAQEMSGISHAITLREPLRVQEVGKGRYIVSGTPTDCIYLGLYYILDRRPAFVFSGVNRGPNLGYDVIYSGTVAGAMEGLIHGISAVSFSLASQNSFNFSKVEPHLEKIISKVIDKGLPQRMMLNVNFPDPAKQEYKGTKITRLGRRFYGNDIIKRIDPRGGEYLWIGGTRVEMENDIETDCGAVLAGYISVTPLSPDITGHSALEKLKDFDL